MLDPILTTVGLAAGKELLKQAFFALSATTSEKSKRLFQKLNNDRIITDLYNRLSEIRQIKTIVHNDVAVDLMRFYCDSHVYVHNKRHRIDTFADLHPNKCILLEGIAGQGKSVFLRYLCSVELMRGTHFPIFAELRRLEAGETLQGFLMRTLHDAGIDLDDEMWSDLLKSKRALILLDGFDEIIETSKNRISFDIDRLATYYPLLDIIVSSRPGSGLENSYRTIVAQLSDLEGNEYEAIIDKTANEALLANQLKMRVQTHRGQIKNLLVTPLLATLLVLQYQSFQFLPDQLSEFYDELFYVLFRKHDGKKLGYKRHRLCKLSESKFREAFTTFCFFSKSHLSQIFSWNDVIAIAQSALEHLSLDEQVDNFVNDIVDITCLLLKDGNDYRFIHKSVQEYYTALYVREQPDVLAKEFYLELSEDPQWAAMFQQEMNFLHEIDAYRYSKYGVLRFLCKLFSTEQSTFKNAPTDLSYTIIENRLLHCFIESHLIAGKLNFRFSEKISVGPLVSIDNLVYSQILKSIILTGIDRDFVNSLSNQITAVNIYVDRGSIPRVEIRKAAINITNSLFDVGKITLDYILNHEDNRAIARLKKLKR